MDGLSWSDLMKTTADLCDIYGKQIEVLPPIFRHYGGKRMFYGSVVTVRTFDDNSLVRSTLEQEGLGRILVVDGGGSNNCALLGDQLAELAIRGGWAGLLINGCVRDSREIRTMSLGIMARATHPRKSVKAGRGEKDVDLLIEGISVKPGNYLYADEDGVVISSESLV